MIDRRIIIGRKAASSRWAARPQALYIRSRPQAIRRTQMPAKGRKPHPPLGMGRGEKVSRKGLREGVGQIPPPKYPPTGRF